MRNTKTLKANARPGFDVNLRIVAASLTVGLGFSGMVQFFLVLGIRRLPIRRLFSRYNKHYISKQHEDCAK